METNEKQNNANVKKCSRCGQEKELDCFGHHPKSKDGHLAECKVCRGGKDTRPEKRIDNEVKELLNSIPQPVKYEPKPAEMLTDKALADELRRRGYEVKAIKTIEI